MAENAENCNRDCSSCSQQDCSERDFHVPCNAYSSIRHVIGVLSGKGGVGKSVVTASLATTMRKKGYEVGIMDADITGPSIPKLFGVHGLALSGEEGIYPSETSTGIKIMSLNLLTENETDPVIWRGPVIGSVVKQFWTDVAWGYLDYLFIDMPPGTGDVPLTVFQSIQVDGIVVVTSPQDLVSMIVTKAVKMAQMMNIPILGIIENYSYFKCPDCGKEHKIFGESHLDEVADANGIPVLGRLPIDPGLAAACDEGRIESFEADYFNEPVSLMERSLMASVRTIVAVAAEDGTIFQHFGRCPSFEIYTVEGVSVVGKEILDSNGTGHSALADLLSAHKVNIVICGGIGQGAIYALQNHGIQVIPGATGSSEKAVLNLLAGNQVGDPNFVPHTHGQDGEGDGSCCE